MSASAKIVKTWASPLARFSLHAVRRFIGERSGIAAVEFASLSVLFVGLILMVAQIGLYFYFSTTLYYVTQEATRQILTGYVAQQGYTTTAQYRTNIVCPLL